MAAVTEEMKAARAAAGERRAAVVTLGEAGAVIGRTAEGYRLKEEGTSPTSAEELAKLADFYGTTLAEAFPSYKPTPGELNLAKHLAPALEEDAAA